MALDYRERQTLSLKAFVDSFISPLQSNNGWESDDIIVCALLEAFLWISTGVQITAFAEADAREVVNKYLLSTLLRYSKYDKTVLRAELVEEFIYFQRSGFIWKGVNAQDGELVSTFDTLALVSSNYVNQYSVRTFILGLRFASELVWKKMTQQKLDDGELMEQLHERKSKVANDLTRCAIGAMLTMRHVAAFEAIPQNRAGLLRRLRAIRDWGFGFGSQVTEARFLTVIKEIDQYANAVASRVLQKKTSETLVPAAKEAMQVWHRGTLGVMVAEPGR